MKAIKYTVLITNSFFEYSHGMQYSITEIFIPELKVCVNIGDGNLNVIPDQLKPRSLIRGTESEIDLPHILINMIMQELESKRFHEVVKEKVRYLFEEPKKPKIKYVIEKPKKSNKHSPAI